MAGSFEATPLGADRAAVAAWFAAHGWDAAEIARGNWVVRRGGSELVVSLLPRHNQPVSVRGLLANPAAEGPWVCRVLEAAPGGYSSRWFDGSGTELGAQIVEVMAAFPAEPVAAADGGGM